MMGGGPASIVVVVVRCSMVCLDSTREIIRGRQERRERLTIGDNALIGNRQGDVEDDNRVLGKAYDITCVNDDVTSARGWWHARRNFRRWW